MSPKRAPLTRVLIAAPAHHRTLKTVSMSVAGNEQELNTVRKTRNHKKAAVSSSRL